MNKAEQVAYLRGLAEGLGLTKETEAGSKFYLELLNCLEDLSTGYDLLEKEHKSLANYVDQMDEALAELEEECHPLFEDDEDADFWSSFDNLEVDEDAGFDPIGEYTETACPDCHQIIGYFDDSDEHDGSVQILCPKCDAVVATIGEDDNAVPAEDADITD